MKGTPVNASQSKFASCISSVIRRGVVAAVLSIAAVASAWAQPAAAPAPPPPPPAYEGSAEFAFVATSGNASTQTLGMGGEVIARPGAWTLKTKAAFVQNEADDVLKARSFAALFRASREVRPHLAFYGQYDYLRNSFAGIMHRNAVEGGLSWQAVDRQRQSLRFDVGLGYANERRFIGPDLSNAVLSTGIALKFKLSDTAEVSDDARAVYSLSDGDQWRADNIAALTAKLTTLLSLKVSHTTRFVNAPAFGFEKTDTITAVALVAKF